jgi:hypothetical protein
MAGVMPMGVLDGETVKDAPGQYRAELERRGEKELNLLLRPDK